jgi:hypothetical protein
MQPENSNTMRKYQFFRKETNKWERVLLVPWVWRATYNDGTFLEQYGEDGIFHQFAEIDQSKLQLFQMASVATAQVFTLKFDPINMKLIHFYRNQILNAGTSDEKRVRIICFGYERLGAKNLMAILPNNELFICDDLNTVDFDIA